MARSNKKLADAIGKAWMANQRHFDEERRERARRRKQRKEVK